MRFFILILCFIITSCNQTIKKKEIIQNNEYKKKDSILSLNEFSDKYVELPQLLSENLNSFYSSTFNSNKLIIDSLDIQKKTLKIEENKQTEYYTFNNFILIYEKRFKNDLFNSSSLSINGTRFELTDYKSFFLKEIVDGKYSLASTVFYIIQIKKEKYFIFDAGLKDCVGSLCRYSKFFIFNINKKTNKPQSLHIIDHYVSLFNKRFLFGLINTDFCYYDIEIVSDSIIEIKPYTILLDSIFPTKNKNKECFLKFKISKKFKIIENEKQWCNKN